MDYIQKISDQYSITKNKAKDLFIESKNEIWMDRTSLARELNVTAKSIDRILSNLGLFDLSNKKSTTKAIIRDYVRFILSRNNNLIEAYNLKVINSLFTSRKLKTKEKRKKRLARIKERTIVNKNRQVCATGSARCNTGQGRGSFE